MLTNIYIVLRKKPVFLIVILLNNAAPLDSVNNLPEFTPHTNQVLSSVSFTPNKIIEIINKLNSKKAHGHDGISIAMLRLCPNEISIPISLIFNKALASGIFPDNWKMANVQPVHKKNSRQIKTNYRPISLPPIMSKIFEKIIFDTMYTFLLKII